MVRCPFASFRHEHRFSVDGEGTLMVDLVDVRMGLGPLRPAADLFAAAYLRHLLRIRNAVMRSSGPGPRGSSAGTVVPSSLSEGSSPRSSADNTAFGPRASGGSLARPSAEIRNSADAEVAMSVPSTTLEDVADRLAPRRRWIDVLLLAAGVACLTRGWWLPAAALVAFGLVTPLLQRSGRCRGFGDAAHLVPADVADAHAQILAAATLPGAQGATRVVEASEDAVLEVAAVLGGRPPRGAAQRRFVAAHVAVMADTAAELRQWSDAWLAARAELGPADGMEVDDDPAQPQGSGGTGVVVLTLVLAPFFALWDGLGLVARALVALGDGLTLRLSITSRALVALAARARAEWTEALAAARGRFLASRARLRLHLRRARRAVTR